MNMTTKKARTKKMKDKIHLPSLPPQLLLYLVDPLIIGRPPKDQYYLGIADAVAKRSTCMVRQYGAVIVKDDEIISTGYNGSPRGLPNCIDENLCPRSAFNPSLVQGKEYDRCVSVHAEMNAIISSRRADMAESTLYLSCFDYQLREQVYGFPCDMCTRLMLNAGIRRLVIWEL